jgi:hypothetical protein
MKNFTERLDSLHEEARIFIEQTVSNKITDINKFIKFEQDLYIEEGTVLGISKNKDEEISIVLLNDEVGEISFINLEFMRIDETITIAEELDSGIISIDSLDSI